MHAIVLVNLSATLKNKSAPRNRLVRMLLCETLYNIILNISDSIDMPIEPALIHNDALFETSALRDLVRLGST